MKGIKGVTDEEIVLLVEAEIARRAIAAEEKQSIEPSPWHIGQVFSELLVGPNGHRQVWGFRYTHFRPAKTRSGWRTAGEAEAALHDYHKLRKWYEYEGRSSVRNIDADPPYMPKPTREPYKPPTPRFSVHRFPNITESQCPGCGSDLVALPGGAAAWCSTTSDVSQFWYSKETCRWVPEINGMRVGYRLMYEGRQGNGFREPNLYRGGFASALLGEPWCDVTEGSPYLYSSEIWSKGYVDGHLEMGTLSSSMVFKDGRSWHEWANPKDGHPRRNIADEAERANAWIAAIRASKTRPGTRRRTPGPDAPARSSAGSTGAPDR